MAKVQTNMLSRMSLIFIVDGLRKKGIIPDSFIAGVYQGELDAQVTATNLQLKAIDTALKTTKLSKDLCKALTEKRYRLATERDMKVELVKALVANADKTKS